MANGVGTSEKIFSIVCLASAFGLMSYWISFMSSQPAAPTPLSTIYLSSGIIGAVCVSLIYLGIDTILSSVKSRPREALVLTKDEEGRIKSIETKYFTEEIAPAPKPVQKLPRPQKRKLAGFLRIKEGRYKILVAALIAVALGGYVSSILILGTTTPIMVVEGESMKPTINRGDIVFVRGVQAKDVKTGDIIVYTVPEQYERFIPPVVIHRVTEVKDTAAGISFRTKGDNNPSADPYDIPADNLLGVYNGRIPYIGLSVLFLKSPFGLALVAIIIIASFSYDYYYGKEERGAAKVVKAVQGAPIKKREEMVELPRFKSLRELDELFLGGKISFDDYLKERKLVLRQIKKPTAKVEAEVEPKEEVELKPEVKEFDETEFMILKLVSERSSILEIALRLYMDPSQVEEKVASLVKKGYLNQDLSLTAKGLEKVWLTD